MNRWLRYSGTLAAAGTALGLTLVVASSPVKSASAPSCSIQTMAVTDGVGIGLSDSKRATSEAASASVMAAFAVSNPNADIVEPAVEKIDAPNVPPIDGHLATVIAFTDETPTGASGPAGHQGGPYVIGCGLAFYDSVTGEFLASVNRLDEVH